MSRSWWICLSILAGCVEKGDVGDTDTEATGGSASGAPESGGSSESTAGTSTTGTSTTGTSTTGTSGGDSTGEPGTSTTGSTSTGGVDTTGEPGTSTGGQSTGETGDGESTDTSGGTTTGGETTGDESSGTDTAAGPSFEGEIQPIFSDECGCHKGKGGEDPVLSEGKAYDNIVGVSSDDIPEMKLVDPGSSQTSYLWHKINNTHKSVGGKGKRMPPGSALSAEQIELVAQWIDAGALP